MIFTLGVTCSLGSRAGGWWAQTTPQIQELAELMVTLFAYYHGSGGSSSYLWYR